MAEKEAIGIISIPPESALPFQGSSATTRSYIRKTGKNCDRELLQSMKATDIFHRWVSWSESDQCYIGYCPDLFLGGVHGDDPIEVARELQSVIDEWEEIFERDHRTLPEAKTRPMRELV